MRALAHHLTVALAATAVTTGVLVALPAASSAASPDVVINEVYGGGGNAGATWTNDFVELRNLGTTAVDLSGWSVQYGSAGGTTWQVTPLTGSLAAGASHLVQEAKGSAGTTPLPAPDDTGTVSMSATAGKVALVRSATALACGTSCGGAAVDLVGWGGANDFEGAVAPATTSTTSLARTGTDTDDNAADFTTGAPTPVGSAGGTTTPPPSAGTDCSAADTSVGAVQGSGATTPLAGQRVSVQGTVVGDYEGQTPGLRGFYLQDAGDGEPATSDGIFVFDNLGGVSPNLVSLGQVVQVQGVATENQGQTQVTATAIDTCDPATDHAVAAVDVTLPLATADALEPFEGMVVRAPQTLTVTEMFQLGRFGQVTVSAGGRLRQPTAEFAPGSAQEKALQAANDLDQLVVDDASQAQNPDPIVFGRDGQPLSASNTLRGGDTVTGATGVLTYTWGGNAASPNAFRLRPVGSLGGSARFEAADPRPSGAPDAGGTGPNGIRVAGANLLNFFTTLDTTGDNCAGGVGGAPLDCRGANTSAEYQRQLAKEVAALTALDADVLAVMELENDGYGPGSAENALVTALDAHDGAGTWAYVDPDAATGVVNSAGTDAIKAALIYRADRVTPVQGSTRTDRAAGVFERNPVATTFATTTGQRLTVVANHFKSKGSCPAAGTDPGNEDSGDGQSCWAARRTAQATELARWVAAEVAPQAGTGDTLLMGDLNSYAAEDPIAALEQAGYTNLPKAFHGSDAYSYVFDGQWGYLDHALASPSLRAKVTGVQDVHTNADEPSVLDYNTEFKTPGQVASLYAPDRYRTSDHDPVVVGADLGKAAATTAVTAPDATVGQTVRWTATVASAGPLAPTGTVQFAVDGVRLGAPVPVTGGTATSPALPMLVPGALTVTAAYSGDDAYAGSASSTTQAVRFAVTVTSPAPGARFAAGSRVPVSVRLADAAGRPADVQAAAWSALCRVTVSASGAQALAPACAGYDLRARAATATWSTARRGGTGAATVSVSVTYPGLPAQTVDVPVTLT